MHQSRALRAQRLQCGQAGRLQKGRVSRTRRGFLTHSVDCSSWLEANLMGRHTVFERNPGLITETWVAPRPRNVPLPGVHSFFKLSFLPQSPPPSPLRFSPRKKKDRSHVCHAGSQEWLCVQDSSSWRPQVEGQRRACPGARARNASLLNKHLCRFGAVDVGV